MTTLDERLARGDVIVMDGGVSTEIQLRGVAMDSRVWSGAAHHDHPDVARRVHEDYIRAGAAVITANTFATARHVLESAGLGDQFAAINREAVAIAKQARDNAAAGDVWIAGSMSCMPPLTAIESSPRGANIEANYRDQADILVEAGVDILVAEMMTDTGGAAPLIRAAAAAGAPLWVGFSASYSAEGSLIGYRLDSQNAAVPTEDFGALVDAILALGGDVAGVMHSAVDATGPALDVLSARWTGPTMAYAETGRFGNPDWEFEQVVAPEAYAEDALRWIVEHSAQIVGGCCGTGPEHIRVLKERLPERLPGR